MAAQIVRVPPREAFNRVAAESVLMLDCCLTPADIIPGAVALDIELSPLQAAVSAAHEYATDELGPENAWFAVVFDDGVGAGARGREVAEWLVREAKPAVTQVWMVDREVFAREYGFIMVAPQRRAFVTSGGHDRFIMEGTHGGTDSLSIYPQEIVESLFLGSIHALEPNVLDNLRITHVVSVMDREIAAAAASAVVERAHLHCRIADSTDADLGPTFDEALPFIRAALSTGGRVLVHCEQGQSRSTSVVIAHILRSTPGMGAGEAFALVKSQRPLARPNSGFWNQLQQISQQLAADSPTSAA